MGAINARAVCVDDSRKILEGLEAISCCMYCLSYGLNLEIGFFNVTGKPNNSSKVLPSNMKPSAELMNCLEKQSRLCWWRRSYSKTGLRWFRFRYDSSLRIDESTQATTIREEQRSMRQI